jgi:polysaccharide pyruvyl transferase WcaK-like protein
MHSDTRKKIKYLLAGYYGFQNTGDDSFCLIGSWGIDQFWGGGEIKFLSSEVPVLVVPGSAALNKRYRKYVGYSRVYQPLQSILSELRADRIIFMGGSIFSRKPKTIDRKLMPWMARSGTAAFGAAGVSIGPFKTRSDYEWVRDFLQNFTFIAVRDTQSYETACEMGYQDKVVKAFDLAVLLPLLNQDAHVASVRRQSEPAGKKVLGVSVCHYERYRSGGNLEIEHRREKKMLAALDLVVKNEDLKIKLFVFNGNQRKGDVEITDRFYRHLNQIDGADVEVIPYQPNPLKTWDEVQKCDAFFGVRLHSAIFAYTAEIPFILVEYHRKCTDFLTEIGCKEPYRVPSEMKEPDEVAALLHSLFSEQSCWSLPLHEAQELALQNFHRSPWFCDPA